MRSAIFSMTETEPQVLGMPDKNEGWIREAEPIHEKIMAVTPTKGLNTFPVSINTAYKTFTTTVTLSSMISVVIVEVY
jgi:hypothetical protein